MRAVESYLRFVSYRSEGIIVRDNGDAPTPITGDNTPLMDRAATIAQAAQVYEIETDLVESVFAAIDSVSMRSFDPNNPDQWSQIWRAASETMPFPALPFPVMWIGFSHPFDAGMIHKIEQARRLTRWGRNLTQENDFLVSPEELSAKAVGMLLAETDSDRGLAILVHEERIGPARMASLVPLASPEEGWLLPESGRWVMTHMLTTLATNAKIVEHPVTPAMRHLWSKSGAHGRFPPRPWHEIRLSADAADRITAEVLRAVHNAFHVAERA